MGGASGYFSGLNRPYKEHKNLDPCPYMSSASFMFLSSFITTGFLSTRATDPDKAHPTDLRRRHRRGGHGEPAQTCPWDSRSAAGHTSGRSAAIQMRPPLPSRTANTASSTSRRGRALVQRAACSAQQDRWTIPTCGWVHRLQGTEQSTRGPRGCVRSDI